MIARTYPNVPCFEVSGYIGPATYPTCPTYPGPVFFPRFSGCFSGYVAATKGLQGTLGQVGHVSQGPNGSDVHGD